ncbi:hypothetical protein NADFUDRAFT_64978 [Nadsonia fulvescens var. elongata DSM 6958]|uniref:Uncharacterized protein n=1 Tax=Nadsonia fulvescens var. elongata DSM 6958 TaxID=857566 RepID=A0A1E3PNH1_9ASCO|nr:hypothetical protein NADFUDRAFT_64978 [Nadsonia fulvescens var. elongata DSM 6958]
MTSNEILESRETNYSDIIDAHSEQADKVDIIRNNGNEGSLGETTPLGDQNDDLASSPVANYEESDSHSTYDLETLDLYGQDLREESINSGDISQMLEQTSPEPTLKTTLPYSPFIHPAENDNEDSCDISQTSESVATSLFGEIDDLSDVSFSQTIEQVVDHYVNNDEYDDSTDMANPNGTSESNEGSKTNVENSPSQDSDQPLKPITVPEFSNLALVSKAQLLQKALLELVDDITLTTDQHKKLLKENVFLQDYIGNLMATSNMLDRKK